MAGQMVKFPANGGTADAYLATPSSDTGPGVIVIQEWWGLTDQIKGVADMFAREGFVALAPDFYHGKGAKIGEPDKAQKLMMEFFQADTASKDAKGAAEYLAGHPSVTSEKVGVIGFCMGGGFALLLSAEGYDAASVNYGIVPSDIDELAPRCGPIVASYGGKDWTTNRVPALREALRAHHVPHDVEVYPAAGHSFLNHKPNGPLLFRPVAKLAHAGPEPAAAADAWRRIEAFFAAHLGD